MRSKVKYHYFHRFFTYSMRQSWASHPPSGVRVPDGGPIHLNATLITSSTLRSITSLLCDIYCMYNIIHTCTYVGLANYGTRITGFQNATWNYAASCADVRVRVHIITQYMRTVRVNETIMLCCHAYIPIVPLYMESIQIGCIMVAEIMYEKW